MIWQRYTFHKIQQNKIQQNLKNNLIRFHVRANSDSSFEQKDSIKNTAQEILKKEGVIQKVKVHFVQEKFPEKTYGQYTFPEGIYDALRIDLGEAKGHNWWCVMFPDLCVTKDDKVRINNTARKKMEKLLGKKAVEKITKDKYLGWLFKA